MGGRRSDIVRGWQARSGSLPASQARSLAGVPTYRLRRNAKHSLKFDCQPSRHGQDATLYTVSHIYACMAIHHTEFNFLWSSVRNALLVHVLGHAGRIKGATAAQPRIRVANLAISTPDVTILAFSGHYGQARPLLRYVQRDQVLQIYIYPYDVVNRFNGHIGWSEFIINVLVGSSRASAPPDQPLSKAHLGAWKLASNLSWRTCQLLRQREGKKESGVVVLRACTTSALKVAIPPDGSVVVSIWAPPTCEGQPFFRRSYFHSCKSFLSFAQYYEARRMGGFFSLQCNGGHISWSATFDGAF